MFSFNIRNWGFHIFRFLPQSTVLILSVTEIVATDNGWSLSVSSVLAASETVPGTEFKLANCTLSHSGMIMFCFKSLHVICKFSSGLATGVGLETGCACCDWYDVVGFDGPAAATGTITNSGVRTFGLSTPKS